ncbi:hypothetical protein BV22DRAFT_827255 [Leucogyrophana mollusca]|uniref:Uncharacterized protein n=1 Tax=Leucogyrophana mollusca TaxID=85980 RepID=A0ACB8B3D8_9AGAM|nr:hypothetical protein BV22DRAFT_827255 [Leucogyrophana mollusca]
MASFRVRGPLRSARTDGVRFAHKAGPCEMGFRAPRKFEPFVVAPLTPTSKYRHNRHTVNCGEVHIPYCGILKDFMLIDCGPSAAWSVAPSAALPHHCPFPKPYRLRRRSTFRRRFSCEFRPIESSVVIMADWCVERVLLTSPQLSRRCKENIYTHARANREINLTGRVSFKRFCLLGKLLLVAGQKMIFEQSYTPSRADASGFSQNSRFRAVQIVPALELWS